MSTIYHITSRSTAQAAQQAGEYRSESLAQQGFIHFSFDRFLFDLLFQICAEFLYHLHDLLCIVAISGRCKENERGKCEDQSFHHVPVL